MKNLIYVLGVALLTSCSAGKKQFEKGNYELAIEKAINRLQDNPDSKKAKSTLSKAYPAVNNIYLSRVQTLQNSADEFKWDGIASSYSYLNSLYARMQRCPACFEAVPKLTNYQLQYEEAASLAAEERYSAGLTELAKGTREDAKKAFFHFMRVEELQSNYKDTPTKLEEARYNATLHVVLEQIPVHSRSLGLSHEFFQNRLDEEIARRVNEFVRFYSPAEASRIRLEKTDHVVVLQFDDFAVGQVFLKESSKTVTRDSVIVGQTEVDGKVYDVYGSVEAELITYTKYIDSGGLLDMKIFDAATDRVLLQRKMPGTFNWVSKWATYKGDKRALTEEELELTNLQEPPQPSSQFLFEQFCRPIYSQTVNNLRSFYSGY